MIVSDKKVKRRTLKKKKAIRFGKKIRKKLRMKCNCPNNGLFLLSLLSLIFFLLFEITTRIYNLYQTIPFVDVPSHFFAGVALGIGISWIISLMAIKYQKTTVIFLTFLSAVVWEILETLQELVFYNPPYLKDIFFWDGFSDIVVTVIGGLAGVELLFLLKKRFRLSEGIHISKEEQLELKRKKFKMKK